MIFFTQHKEKIFEFTRFGLVGGIATAIHYFVYLFLLKYFSSTLAYTIGYIVSFCFNFILTNLFTFKTKPTIFKGIGFLISHAVNYLIQILLLAVFVNTFLGEKLAPLAVYVISVPINFLLIRFVFKKDRK